MKQIIAILNQKNSRIRQLIHREGCERYNPEKQNDDESDVQDDHVPTRQRHISGGDVEFDGEQRNGRKTPQREEIAVKSDVQHSGTHGRKCARDDGRCRLQREMRENYVQKHVCLPLESFVVSMWMCVVGAKSERDDEYARQCKEAGQVLHSGPVSALRCSKLRRREDDDAGRGRLHVEGAIEFERIRSAPIMENDFLFGKKRRARTVSRESRSHNVMDMFEAIRSRIPRTMRRTGKREAHAKLSCDEQACSDVRGPRDERNDAVN